MPDVDVQKVELIGGGLTQDGEHGALVFVSPTGQRIILGVSVEQFPELVRGAALLQTQARKLRGDEVRPIAIERWSTFRSRDGAILTLEMFGGLELRFEVPRGTQVPGSVADE